MNPWTWLPATFGGWDPVAIAETWSIYDCIDAMRALALKASLMRGLGDDRS